MNFREFRKKIIMEDIKGICSLDDLKEKCEDLLKLEKNWDSYDAETIKPELAQVCQKVVYKLEKEFMELTPFYVCSAGDGGLLLEKNRNNKSLKLEFNFERDEIGPQIIFVIIYDTSKKDLIDNKINLRFSWSSEQDINENCDGEKNKLRVFEAGIFPADNYDKTKQLLDWISEPI